VGEAEWGAEEEVAGTEVVAEAGVRGKCKGMKTRPLHEPYFLIAGTELKITSYTNWLSYHKNITLFIWMIFLIYLCNP